MSVNLNNNCPSWCCGKRPEDKEEREKILTYLAKYFGEKSSQEEAPMGIRPVNPLPSL